MAPDGFRVIFPSAMPCHMHISGNDSWAQDRQRKNSGIVVPISFFIKINNRLSSDTITLSKFTPTHNTKDSRCPAARQFLATIRTRTGFRAVAVRR